MIKFTKFFTALAFLLALGLTSLAQKKELGPDQYFKNNFKGIINTLPSIAKWTDDSHVVIRREGKTYEIDCKTGSEKEYSKSTVVNNSSLPEVVLRSNDLFLKNDSADIQLTFDSSKEINPTVSPDGQSVAFTKNNDLYSINLQSKKQTRITNDGSETILNGYASWVYMEEILGRRSRYRAFWWSPDSKHIAFFRFDDSPVPVFTITDAPGLHGVVETERYPKVGDPNPKVKVGIAVPESNKVLWADFNENDDQYFGMPYWKPDGSSLLVQWMNRLQNNLIIYDVNPFNGLKSAFYNEKQKTWINLDDQGDRIHFLENGTGFILLNDTAGWKHMYFYDMKGKLINAVTSGRFTVTDLTLLDEKKGIVYFTARGKENTARNDLYRVGIDGKNLERLTIGEYNNAISISPQGSYFITTYTSANTPPAMLLMNNRRKIIKELGNSKTSELDNYEIAKTEIVRVKSDDGLYDLPMKVTWPVNMDTNKRYPVLISIYGGPDAGTVMDTWLLNGQQQWYAKEGLIQVSMDHRASGHFGKEGVNYMYHNLGYWEIKDYSTMVKWLIENGNADADKVCITGFSYGGYMTCYALTYASDVFKFGMAGGSVTDWTLYDSHYTERFMGTLADNAQGYKNSSALTYVDRYKGGLQIVHGMMDDNVHMQNSIQLISKLQDARKEFEMMLYSGGRHGWGGNKALHFQNLKTTFIYKNLLQKEVPPEMIK